MNDARQAPQFRHNINELTFIVQTRMQRREFCSFSSAKRVTRRLFAGPSVAHEAGDGLYDGLSRVVATGGASGAGSMPEVWSYRSVQQGSVSCGTVVALCYVCSGHVWSCGLI